MPPEFRISAVAQVAGSDVLALTGGLGQRSVRSVRLGNSVCTLAAFEPCAVDTRPSAEETADDQLEYTDSIQGSPAAVIWRGMHLFYG